MPVWVQQHACSLVLRTSSRCCVRRAACCCSRRRKWQLRCARARATPVSPRLVRCSPCSRARCVLRARRRMPRLPRQSVWLACSCSNRHRRRRTLSPSRSPRLCCVCGRRALTASCFFADNCVGGYAAACTQGLLLPQAAALASARRDSVQRLAPPHAAAQEVRLFGALGPLLRIRQPADETYPRKTRSRRRSPKRCHLRCAAARAGGRG